MIVDFDNVFVLQLQFLTPAAEYICLVTQNKDH